MGNKILVGKYFIAKVLNFQTPKTLLSHTKTQTNGANNSEMPPKNADRMANSEYPDQLPEKCSIEWLIKSPFSQHVKPIFRISYLLFLSEYTHTCSYHSRTMQNASINFQKRTLVSTYTCMMACLYLF